MSQEKMVLHGILGRRLITLWQTTVYHAVEVGTCSAKDPGGIH